MQQLYIDHYEQLVEAFASSENEEAAPTWLLLSIKALARGSQPSIYPAPVGYADILERNGLIQSGRAMGRVRSGKTCVGAPLHAALRTHVVIGGLPLAASLMSTKGGMYPLMHAIDQSGWCLGCFGIDSTDRGRLDQQAHRVRAGIPIRIRGALRNSPLRQYKLPDRTTRYCSTTTPIQETSNTSALHSFGFLAPKHRPEWMHRLDFVAFLDWGDHMRRPQLEIDFLTGLRCFTSILCLLHYTFP